MWKLTTAIAAVLALVLVALFAWPDRSPHGSETSLVASVPRTATERLHRGVPAVAANSTPPPAEASSTAPSADAEPETHPITVTGRAIDSSGRAIAGATVWLVSTNGIEKRLGEVSTDENGAFAFRDAPLPLRPQPDGVSRLGTFEVFGVAPGFGFGWCGMKFFRPTARTQRIVNDQSFFENEPIVQDLKFRASTTLAGRVEDEFGLALEGAKVEIIGCDVLGVSDQPLNHREFWAIQHLDDRHRTVRSDADGHFALEGVPADTCLYVHVERPDRAPIYVHASTTRREMREYTNEAETLPMLTGDILFTLPSTRVVHVVVRADDSNTPIPSITVSARGTPESVFTYSESDAEGRVDLSLPPGEYELNALPRQGAEFVERKTTLVVTDAPPEQSTAIGLQRACRLVVDAVDGATGRGLADASFLVEMEDRPDAWTTLFVSEAPDRARTDASGSMRASLRPGRRRLKVGHPPDGYARRTADVRELELPPGGIVHARFELEAAPSQPAAPRRAPEPPLRLVSAEGEPSAIQLPAGAEPGTFHVVIAGRVEWAGPSVLPVEVALRPREDGHPSAAVRVGADASFTLVADLTPGRYSIQSHALTDTLHFDSSGGELAIRDRGEVDWTPMAIRHVLKLEVLEPDVMSSVAEPRPTLRWTPIGGALRYAIVLSQKDATNPDFVVARLMSETAIPELRVSNDLSPGCRCFLTIRALGAAGETIAVGSREFFTVR